MENRYAKSEEEAQERFKKYGKIDPFSEIQPALLNSADILDYVAETSMIYPFYEKEMKSASYEVALLGKVIYWDENGKKVSRDINRDGEFTFKKNSIAFVTPEPTFRIPEYIALRFNLKITHVHRGILLGTGPLVDPGYEGKLLIPLHNLTNNNYKFKGGEGLIWVEFTKLSENKQRWTKRNAVETAIREGEYVPFPEDKKNKEPEYLIAKALKDQGSDSIPSSIPQVVRLAANQAEEAEKSAKKAQGQVQGIHSKLRKVGYVGIALSLIVIFFTIIYGLTPVLQLVNESTNFVRGAQKEYADNQKRQSKDIEDLKKELETLKKNIDDLQKNLPKKIQK